MDRPCGTFDQSYFQDLAIVRTRAQWIMLIIALLFLFTTPLYLSPNLVAMLNIIGISVISAHGLNLLTGYTGQISLGQAALMAVGGYTSAILTHQFGLSIWVTLPIAAITAAIVGLIFGLPSLRVKGFYLAMATLALQFIIPWLIVNVRPDITGGTSALTIPSARLGNIVFNSQQSMFYIIMPMAVIITVVTKGIVRSKVGRAFIAIRDNDLAAEVMGVNIFYYKLLSFFICSLWAGIAGSLWCYWMRAVSYDHFTLMESVWYLGIIIIGGMGSTAGAVMGTILIRCLDYAVKAIGPALGTVYPGMASSITAGMGPLVFGFVVMVFIILEPRGLNHMWNRFKASYRLWPFSY